MNAKAIFKHWKLSSLFPHVSKSPYRLPLYVSPRIIMFSAGVVILQKIRESIYYSLPSQATATATTSPSSHNSGATAAVKSPPGEILYLSKNDYFERILGNKNEYFFLIVYRDNNPEASRNAIKAAKHIRDMVSMNIDSKDPANVYLITRPTLNDIKNLVNRIKNLNIFERDSNEKDVEIYLKTPFSSNYVYYPFKPEKFFEPSGKKFLRKTKKFFNLLEKIDKMEDFWRKLQSAGNRLNAPVIIHCASKTPSTGQKGGDPSKRFSKMVFQTVERKLLSHKSRFYKITDEPLMKRLNLSPGETYIFQNDIVSLFPDLRPLGLGENMIRIRDPGNSGKHYELEKFSLEHAISSEVAGTSPADIKSRKDKELVAFHQYVLPRIFLLRDNKFSSVGSLFKRISFNKNKPVCAVFLSEDDKKNKTRVTDLIELYYNHSDEFVFLIVDTPELEDLFPHINRDQPRFSIFNFFQQDKSRIKFSTHYKNLIHPYEKYYLSDTEEYFERLEVLEERIKQFFQGKLEKALVATKNDKIQEINGDLFGYFLKSEKNQFQKDFFFVEVWDKTPLSMMSQAVVTDLSNEGAFGDHIEVMRMNHLNESPFLKQFENYPVYLFVDLKKKLITYYKPETSEIGFSKSKLREKILEVLNEKTNPLIL